MVVRQEQAAPSTSVIAKIVGILAVVMVVRQLVLQSGWIIGSTQTTLLTLATIGVGVLVIAKVVGVPGVGQVIAAAAALAGLFGLTELLLPAPRNASAPAACPGAQTRGLEYLAASGSDGVSVREGPGRSFPQSDRLLGDCSLGFVGYCLGEPTLDVFYIEFGREVADARWLVLPKGRGYVAAGAVRSQEAEDRLLLPQPDCPSPEEFKIEAPELRFSQEGLEEGQVKVSAIAAGAPTVGFASHHLEEGQPVFTRLALDPTEDEFGFMWSIGSQPASDGVGQGELTLVGVSCLAAEVPGPASALSVTLENGSTVISSAPADSSTVLESLPEEHRQRVIRKACLLPGDGVPPADPLP